MRAKLSDNEIETIIQRIGNGERAADIATEFKISPAAIYQRISKYKHRTGFQAIIPETQIQALTTDEKIDKLLADFKLKFKKLLVEEIMQSLQGLK